MSGRQAIAYRRMRNAAAGEAARAGTRDPTKHNTSAPVETQSGHDRGLSSPPTVRFFTKVGEIAGIAMPENASYNLVSCKYRTFSEVTEEHYRNHPEEIDGFLKIAFEEYAKDNDTGALLSALRIISRANSARSASPFARYDLRGAELYDAIRQITASCELRPPWPSLGSHRPVRRATPLRKCLHPARPSAIPDRRC